MASTNDWGDVADLPIGKPPTKTPFGPGEVPSDDDMGFNDPENIHYVNMEAPGLAARFKDRIIELEQMLQLTHQLATIHAGIQVMQRKAEGSLPRDDTERSRWRRSQYRARVIDTYFQGGVYPWMYSPQNTTISNGIDIERSRFHWQILTNLLAGIVLPRPLAASLEAIFKGIGDTINETTYDGDSRSFWSLLQVYTYDNVRQDLRASFRNITYTLDHAMHTVSRTKSTKHTVQVRLFFGKADFSFNESTWRAMRPEVENYIRATGIGNIRNPPSVPV